MSWKEAWVQERDEAKRQERERRAREKSKDRLLWVFDQVTKPIFILPSVDEDAETAEAWIRCEPQIREMFPPHLLAQLRDEELLNMARTVRDLNTDLTGLLPEEFLRKTDRSNRESLAKLRDLALSRHESMQARISDYSASCSDGEGPGAGA